MSFSWTPHRFSGGALAFDVANSIVLRFDDRRRVDGSAVPEQMDGFAHAATLYCAERDLFGPLLPVTPRDRPVFIALREAIDGYFRAFILGGESQGLLADLLNALAAMLRQSTAEPDLGPATVRSTLKLLAMPDEGRMKICPNCGWLFLDRSRNRSRAWCDMAVCGNRAKASRHYNRRKQEEALSS